MEVLERMFGAIHVPTAVVHELEAGIFDRPENLVIAEAAWVLVRKVHDEALVRDLEVKLDDGEAEAIALALELDADLVILDEKAGRREAEARGLNVIGLVGLIVQAKNRGMVTHVRPVLDDLRTKADFYPSTALYGLALRLADERDDR